MRPASFCGVPAPSTALLKFLRAQNGAHHFPPSAPNALRCCRPLNVRPLSPTTSRPLHPLTRSTARPGSPSSQPCDGTWSHFWSPNNLPPPPSPKSSTTLRRPSLTCSVSPTARRAFSTSDKTSFWNLWGLRKRKPGPPLQPHDLPPLASFLDDNASLGRIPKPDEVRLRCTEFDENGNVTLVNGEFKKSELIAKYGLLPRDLRKIDSSLLPHILVRSWAILLNLLHLRVLIKHNRVLVFDAYGSTDSYTQSVFMYDLEGKLRQKESRAAGSLPYEFRALEAVLISVTTALESEFEGVREPVVRVLRELEEDIDRDKLRYLLIYSKKLGTFEQKARLVRDALDELLEADDDLSAMYLTEKAAGHERDEEEHTEVEMLLESYHKVTDEIVQAAENLVSNIRNTEEIVKAILDENRNSLMLLELKFSIYTLGLGAGTFIAALYGMNLKNFIEESDLGFGGVSAACAFLSALVLAWGLKKLRTVQRVSMWGERGQHRLKSLRGSWRDLGNEGPIGALGKGAGTAGLGPVGYEGRMRKGKVAHLQGLAQRQAAQRLGTAQGVRRRTKEERQGDVGGGATEEVDMGLGAPGLQK